MASIDIPCPDCGAASGEPCRDRPSNALATWRHLGRNQAASAARPRRQKLFTEGERPTGRHEYVLLAFALGVLMGVCLAAPLAIIGLRPSPECAETCEVLESEAIIQVGHTVWCHDPVSTFPTDCAE